MPRSWIRNLFAARPQTAPRPKLGLESLESREVPAVLTVTTLLDESNGLSVGGVSLREAIAQANSTPEADTIRFGVTGTIGLSSPLPEIATAIDIAGPGANQLTVRRASADVFGVFGVTFEANARIAGVTVRDGEALYGGGIANGGTLLVENAVVTGNRATDLLGGGGIVNSGTLTVRNSTISANAADVTGGGVSNVFGGTVTLQNTTLRDNIAGFFGGGLATDGGTVWVTGGSVRTNAADWFGGGIRAAAGATVSLDTVSVSDNTAQVGAGINSEGPLVVRYSTITNNTASISGGGIATYADATITDTVIGGNSAAFVGGGVSGDVGTLTITGSTVRDNTAFVGAGIDNPGRLVLTGSTVRGNSATGTAAGIMNHALGNATIRNSTIAGNTSEGEGGAAIQSEGMLALFDSAVSGNVSGGGAGGIWSSGTLTLLNASVSGNTGAVAGGVQTSGTAGVVDSTITGNAAGSAGGGILSTAGSLSVSRTTVSGNTAVIGGGGIAAFDGDFSLVHSTVSGNSVTGSFGSGGGVVALGRSTIADSIITGNDAMLGGGGSGGGVLAVVRTTVSDNEALAGGGLMVGSGMTTVINSTVSGNRTVGATIDPAEEVEGELTSLPFHTSGGGIAVLEEGRLELVNGTVSGNTAMRHGGGILNYGGVVAVRNSTVTNNRADSDANGSGQGGGITSTVPFALVNSIASGNFRHANTESNIGGEADAATSFNNLIGFRGTGALENGINGNIVGVSDPRLNPLADNGGPTFTHTLMADSPARNAGILNMPSDSFDLDHDNNRGEVLPVDQRGFPRFTGTLDIGAVEMNAAPTGIAISNANIDENLPAGTIVGTLSTSDADAGDSHTYSLVSSSIGAGNNGSFTIDGHLLRTTESFNAEAGTLKFILVRSTDSAGQTVDRYFQIGVRNVNEAPTAISLSNSTLPENQPAGTVIGTFGTTDPDANQTFIYELVGGGPFTISGNQLRAAVGFDFEAQSSYSIRVRSTDGGGLAVEKDFTITVTDVAENTAPTVAVSGPAVGVRFQPLAFTAAATDPDAGDTAFTYSINWGDGSPVQTVSAGRLATATHEYATSGSYAVSVSATDAHGASSGSATRAVTIANAALLADPLHPGQKALYVGGTAKNDAISIDRTVKDRYEVTIETATGKQPAKFAQSFNGPISRVVVFGGDGDDGIAVGNNLKADAWLFGGTGNDALAGGGGNDILSGEAGNDLLTARGGRDILLGGTGSDVLAAGSGGDLLIAGTTAYDLDEIALSGIQVEWSSARDPVARAANLRNILKASGPAATVFDDGAADILSTGSGMDWVFGKRIGGVRDLIVGGTKLFDELA